MLEPGARAETSWAFVRALAPKKRKGIPKKRKNEFQKKKHSRKRKT
jgi:hypothetical protein